MERSKRELIYDRINTLAHELYSADVMELRPYQKQKKESENQSRTCRSKYDSG